MLNKKNRFFSFFYPLTPIKVFKSTNAMLLISSLLALRLIFEAISVNIPGIILSISINWLPLMLMGWYFGPIYGLFLGAISDTLSFLIFSNGFIWYWAYAIQEPCVGFVSGLVSSICKLRINREKTNIFIDILIQQVIYLLFGVGCYSILIIWMTPSNTSNLDASLYNLYKWLSLGLILSFFIIMECFSFYHIIYNKDNKRVLITFIYATSLVVVIMLIFSLLLGPIVTVSYLKYVNGHYPSQWLNIGAAYFLIPRIIVDSIKVPIEALLLTFIVINLDPMIQNLLNKFKNQWNSV